MTTPVTLFRVLFAIAPDRATRLDGYDRNLTGRFGCQIGSAVGFQARARSELAGADFLPRLGQGLRRGGAMVKAVAETRDWKHRSHGDLYRVVSGRANQLNDQRIRILFHSANTLHENFYEGPMPENLISDALDDVDQMLLRLKAIIDEQPA